MRRAVGAAERLGAEEEALLVVLLDEPPPAHAEAVGRRRIDGGSAASQIAQLLRLPSDASHVNSASVKTSMSTERTFEMCEPSARCAPAQWMQSSTP